MEKGKFPAQGHDFAARAVAWGRHRKDNLRRYREKEKLDSGVFLRDPSLEAGLPTDLAIIQMPRSAWNELSGILYRYNAALVGSINLPTPHEEAVVTNTLTHDFAA